MRPIFIRFGVVAFVSIMLVVITLAQGTRRRTQSEVPAPPVTQQPKTEPTPPEDQSIETLRIATDLVTVPIIATDRNGNYIADLRKEEFQIQEDGTKQEIAIFATVSAPFHVVLMLDTSASTREKLIDIKRAASAFVEQLQVQDRVKVISFSDEISEHNEFTSDRALLHSAIKKSQAGEGTKLYDAFSIALDSLLNISGRKAIVLFTDGVDRISDRATFNSTLRGLDESGVVVYPIRYDTRAETEAMLREQAQEQTLPTIGVMRAPSSGTTVPTFPSDDPNSVKIPSSRPKTGPLGLPLPEDIMRRRREERTRDEGRYPSPSGVPEPGGRPSKDPTTNPSNYPGGGRDSQIDRSISAMLDLAYSTADSYLKELEKRSGGRLVRADTLTDLPDAFAKIAAELRTQYALGYYPLNKTKDGKYRKIRVTCSRKDVVLRSRPGYIAREN